jgi:2-C-methyl-D-erythritol 4-phosphate cytidylyltransferase
MKTYCIILSSGKGVRFGGDLPKQFVRVNGRMIIEYTLDACLRARVVDEILLVVSEPWRDEMELLVAPLRVIKPIRVVVGGATRQESCERGVTAISDSEAKVIIHNGVQPFITPKTLDDCAEALDHYDAASVGSPCVYTVLELNDNRELKRIIRRSHSVNDLGPECFKLSFLRKVFDVAGDDKDFTNITGMVMKYGLGQVYVVDGDPSNTKITYKDDLLFAEKKFAEYKFLEFGKDNQ